ncbi:MAG: hypothetical protein Aurels2KO_15950 [Aureliella sp.]
MTTQRTSDGKAFGRWWAPRGDRIDCNLCPRHCSLKDGDRGFCFVRENVGGQMVLSTYGRSTGFCIDPIEKKPLNHFLPGTAILSFGTAGCNLGCKFCQNWDISKSRQVQRLSSAAEPDDIAAAARSNGCQSVAFTYNDPVIWAEYAIDTAAACRDRGLAAVAVTAGYICPEPRTEFFSAMDAANVDLKAFTEEFYEKITYSHLAPVLDTIRFIKHETDCWLELTNLIIPQTNDSPGDLRKMCDWVMEAVGDAVPIHFTAFHPDFRMMDKPRTDPDTLTMAVEIAKTAGVKFAYVGNVHDRQRQSTFCPSCDQLLIERDWHQLSHYGLDADGKCSSCGAVLPGRFQTTCGSWGNRRLPIVIQQNANSTRPTIIDSANGDSQMSADAKSQSASPTAATPATAPLRLDRITNPQRQAVTKAAADWVAQAVGGEPIKTTPDILGPLTQRIVMGVFVTLKRGDVLRGCCGVLGKPMPLAAAVASAAAKTAKEDKRFAPISRSELKHLTIEVTILGPFQNVAPTGPDRATAVEIGKHGVMIQSGKKSGLLLPNVAVENNWNAKQFLEAVCGKAGLRSTAWESNDVKLMVFAGEPMSGQMDQLLPAGLPESIADPISEEQLTSYAQLAGQNIVALSTGGTPSYVVPHLDDLTVNAVVVSMQWTRDGEQGEKRQGNALQVSFRPGVPLQSTLFQMCQRAARMFQQERFVGQLQIGLTLGFDPALHGWGKLADIDGLDTKKRAIVISDAAHCGFAFDPEKSAEEVRDVLRKNLPISSRDGVLHSLHVVSTMPNVISLNGPTPVVGQGVRPTGAAGKFYPGEDAARRAAVTPLLDNPPAEKVRPLAVMVPHAALKYSGKIAARVWQSIDGLDEQTLLIISPKHTRRGVNWSVCPFDKWRLSASCQFDTDRDLINKLVEDVAPIQADASAHAEEHGIEVQLPILEQLAPSAKVVGLALQGGNPDDIASAAKELAAAVKGMDKPPLFVISSDMNHYAPDEENRRRDRLALDALATGDPDQLREACRKDEISMCGLVPALLVLNTLRELGHELEVIETDYATSAEVNGDKSQVVGYAGALIMNK